MPGRELDRGGAGRRTSRLQPPGRVRSAHLTKVRGKYRRRGIWRDRTPHRPL